MSRDRPTVRVERRDLDAAIDPYASSGYGQAVATSIDAEWIAVVGDGWRLPLVISGPDGAREASTPYGYGGLQIDPSLCPEEVQGRWRATKALLINHSVVSLFLRFPPYEPRQAALANELEGLDVRTTSETILVPTPSADEIWKGMQGRSRTAVRKAEREGFTARVSIAGEPDLLAGSPFRRVYDATMDRLSAPSHLRLTDQYYVELLAALGDDLLLTHVADETGSIVAACLLMRGREHLHYHLSGSMPEAARRGANNLMIWASLRSAAQMSLSAMHLGGGTAPDDSLFRFKQSFGGSRMPFHTGRAVINPTVYAALTEQRAREVGIAPLALHASGYFPAFRASVNEIGEASDR